MTTFERYAPFIREYIYKKDWKSLNPVQIEACEAIMDTSKDVIIASQTASGKTEAAFFPILSLLEKNPSESVSILYISPLKALINDQFKRLGELLSSRNFPVWAWHGDIPQNQKERAKDVKRGLVQITPESLEALLIRHPDLVSELFSDLRFIIIDEIHSLMGTDRGLQVISLIERIERLCGSRPRRVALSATLGDYESAKYYLSSGRPENAVAVGLKSKKRAVGLSVESFVSSGSVQEATSNYGEFLDYIYNRTKGIKSLIFTNSRKEAETTVQGLKMLAENRGENDVFAVHHGSVSAELRREIERRLRESEDPIVVAATLTLELGIDIGDLDQTIQIGAPYTCSSFLQRLGRSGRQYKKSLMRFINLYDVPDGKFSLPWELLRSIAVIELSIKKKWIEPFERKKKPYSLLVHQSLSILASFGELSPAELARNVLTLFPFKGTISKEEYKRILYHLIYNDYIHRLDEGNLILGLAGERLVGFYDFYSVFEAGEEYQVISDSRTIGSISEPASVGEKFSLAGRSWEVVETDEAAHQVFVVPSTGNAPPVWHSSGIEIDKKLIKTIKEILESDKSYAYLQPQAKKLLKKARAFARSSGILSGIVNIKDKILLFPWTGTKELRTLERLLKYKLSGPLKISRVENRQYYLVITTELKKHEFINALKSADISRVYPDDVLAPFEIPRVDKYDKLVPNDLLDTAYLTNKMDLDGAREAIVNL